jgi:hypothetical protein
MMSPHPERLTEDEQNATAVEISEIAWRNAKLIVRDDQYGDVAQDGRPRLPDRSFGRAVGTFRPLPP